MIKLTVAGGSKNSFGTDPSIELVGSYNGGALIDGAHYVIAPQRVKISGSTPAPATVDGRAGHGIMANWQQDAAAAHALDAADVNYNAALTLDLDALYGPGDTIEKVRSVDPIPPSGGGARPGYFVNSTALHVVAAAPAAGAMAPAIWPSADKASKPWRVADVDGFLSSLPAYASTGAPTWASIAAYWDKRDMGRSAGRAYFYEYLTPDGVTGTLSTYAQDRAELTGRRWAGACGNEWSNTDKTAHAIRALANGCQIVEAAEGFQIAYPVNGGHMQGYQADCAAWLKAIPGGLARYDAIMDLIGGNVLNEYYQVTPGMFDPHDDPLKPFMARRRLVDSVFSTYCLVAGFNPASGLLEDTASNLVLSGLDLVREASGAKVAITGTVQSGSAYGLLRINYAAPPAGLVAGDYVFCAEVTPLAVGTWDWRLGNRLVSANNNLPNPSLLADYRTNNVHGNDVTPMSAMGMLGAGYTPAKEYLQRISADISYGAGNAFGRTFWSTNQAAALAVPQIV